MNIQYWNNVSVEYNYKKESGSQTTILTCVIVSMLLKRKVKPKGLYFVIIFENITHLFTRFVIFSKFFFFEIVESLDLSKYLYTDLDK